MLTCIICLSLLYATDAEVLRLGNDQDPSFASALLFGGSDPSVKVFVLHRLDESLYDEIKAHKGVALCILQLSAFQSGAACEESIKAALSPGAGRRFLLVVANSKICTSAQITFAKRVIDESLTHNESSQVVSHAPIALILIHIAADHLQLRPRYQAIPLNDWSASYIDSFSNADPNEGLKASFSPSAHANTDEMSIDIESELAASASVSTGSVTDASMIPWVRVAFGLADAPTMTDVQNEFGHLIESALYHAVNACKFLQSPRKLSSGKILPQTQFLDAVGVNLSRAAYALNDKVWVIDLLKSRQYLIHTVMKTFSFVWATLLEATVQRACAQIRKGVSTAGLIACVRNTHKWLLTDFMSTLVRRDLASNWNLEALAHLPVESGASCLSLVDASAEDQVNAVSSSLSEQLGNALITCHMIKASVLASCKLKGLSSDAKVISLSSVDCRGADAPSRLPLFNVFRRVLQSLIPRVLTVAKGNVDNHYSIEDAFRAALHSTNNTHDLCCVIALIESRQDLYYNWVRDLMSIALKYSYHSPLELDLLVAIGESMLTRDSASGGNSSTGGIKRNILAWLLHEKEIKASISGISHFLVSFRSIFTSENIQCVIASVRSVGDTQDCFNLLANQGLASLWVMCRDVLFAPLATDQDMMKGVLSSSDHQDALSSWMQAIRDLITISGIDDESLFDTSTEMGQRNAYYFAVMLVLYKSKGCRPDHVYDIQTTDTDSLKLSLGAVDCVISPSDPVHALLATLLLIAPSDVSATVALDSLIWLIEHPGVLFHSPYITLVIAGLLGIKHVPDEIFHMTAFDREIIRGVFAPLTLMARAELLKKLLVTGEGANSAESIIERLLQCTISATSASSAVFIPHLISSVVTPYALANLYTLPELTAVDPPAMVFKEEGGNAIKTVYLASHLQHLAEHPDATLEDMCRQYNSSHGKRSIGGPLVAQVRQYVHAVALLEKATELYSQPNNTGPIVLQCLAVRTIATILNLLPRSMPLFFLGLLADMVVVARVLQDKDLLTVLGIPGWYCAVSPEVQGNMTEADVAELAAATKAQHVRILCVYLASVVVRYEMHRQQLVIPTLQALLNADTTNGTSDDPAALLRLMLDDDTASALALNCYIPDLISMYHFVREKLSYRLRSEMEARQMTIEAALDLLPAHERAEGTMLFKQFLKAWEVLRSHFHTFDICAREVAAAAEIPHLTNQRGRRPTLVSDLVELGGSTEHESMIALMLEKRLLKKVNDVISSDLISRLRSSEEFNSNECLVESQLHSEDLSRLCADSVGMDLRATLLTGSRDDAIKQQLYDYCIAHVTYSTDELIVPVDVDTSDLVDFEAEFRRNREAAARAAQTAAHDAGLVICPQCRMLSERMNGCENLRCGGPEDPYGTGPLAAGRSLGNLGCGHRLHVHNDRVPSPGAYGPIMPEFFADKGQLPADMANKLLPRLPKIDIPVRGMQLNQTALAKFILLHVIHGRSQWDLGGDFFSPLPFAIDATLSTPLKGFSKANPMASLLAEQYDGIFTAGDSVEDDKQAQVRRADVFVRLQLSRDYLRQLCEQKGLKQGRGGTNIEHFAQLIARTNLQHLRVYGEQLLLLSFAVATLLEQSDSNDNMHEAGQSTQAPEVTCGEVIKQLSEKGIQFEVALKNELQKFIVIDLASVVDVVATAGLDGESGTASLSLRSKLSPEDRQRHQQLLDDVNTGLVDVHTLEDTVQSLGALLASVEDIVSNFPDNKPLKELFAIASYLTQKSSDCVELKVIGTGRVKHYKEIVAFTTKLLSLLSYRTLQGHIQYTSSSSSTANAIYTELVPPPPLEDYTHLKMAVDNLTSDADIGDIQLGFHKAQEDDVPYAYDAMVEEEEGEAFSDAHQVETTYKSTLEVTEAQSRRRVLGLLTDTGADQGSHMGEEKEADDDGEDTDSGDERMDIEVEDTGKVADTEGKNLDLAWAVLAERRAREEALDAFITELGLEQASDLEICEEAEVRRMASLLRHKIPVRKFMHHMRAEWLYQEHAWNGQLLPITDLTAAWNIIIATSQALHSVLDELGLHVHTLPTGDASESETHAYKQDLLYLDVTDAHRLAALLKPVPGRKLLKALLSD